MNINTVKNANQKEGPNCGDMLDKKFDEFYFGHGKILLTSEYFILDGAKGLALPTKRGQSLGVRYESSFHPKLHWKSYDVNGDLWFEGTYEFWHFDCLDKEVSSEALFLQKILRQARAQNKHFLRENQDVHVETRLGFSLDWGLGSSSTLIYNIAQWAYISPFLLSFKTYGGSGYDVACAQSDGPILYVKNSTGPYWSMTHFNPSFCDQLYFVHLGKKQNSREAVEGYQKKGPFKNDIKKEFTELTNKIMVAATLDEFSTLLDEHEDKVSKLLEMPKAKESYFKDYWGSVKSLGAWGGDFVLVTSDRSDKETKEYFSKLGHETVLAYNDLILETPSVLPNFSSNFIGAKFH
jgi:mevalonate kinase